MGGIQSKARIGFEISLSIFSSMIWLGYIRDITITWGTGTVIKAWEESYARSSMRLASFSSKSLLFRRRNPGILLIIHREGSLRKRLIDHGCSLRNQSGVAIHRDPRRPRNPSMGPRTEPALSTSFRMPVRNGLPPHPRPSLVQPPNSYLPQLSTVDHLGSGASPAVTREDRFQPHPATLAENLSSEENNHWTSMGHEQIPVASSPSIFVHRSDNQASHQAPLFGQFDNFNHANLPQSQTLRSSPHPMRDFNPSSDNFQAGINFHSQNVATDSDNAFCNSTPRSGGMTELSFYDDSIPHSLEENPAQDNGQLTRPINHASEYMHGGSFGTSTSETIHPSKFLTRRFVFQGLYYI
jgi:hypothetical protein